MTAPAVGRRGELLPAFTLAEGDGAAGFVERYRGRRNLVVVFGAELAVEDRKSVV